MSAFTLTARLRLDGDVMYRISGWRGLCKFDGIEAPDGSTLFGCELRLDGLEAWQPGEERLVSLRFWLPREDAGSIDPGLGLQLFEGAHKIGSGEIVDIADELS